MAPIGLPPRVGPFFPQEQVITVLQWMVPPPPSSHLCSSLAANVGQRHGRSGAHVTKEGPAESGPFFGFGRTYYVLRTL